MLLTQAETTIDYRFKNNDTINGALRLANGHSLTKEDIDVLIKRYNELNKNKVPVVGELVKIPLLNY